MNFILPAVVPSFYRKALLLLQEIVNTAIHTIEYTPQLS